MKYPKIWSEMKAAGISLSAMSSSLGLQNEIFRDKLLGREEFTLAEIEQIGDILKCSLDYLVDHERKTESFSDMGCGFGTKIRDMERVRYKRKVYIKIRKRGRWIRYSIVDTGKEKTEE